MSAPLHPSAALYGAQRAFPALPACVHYAGNERHIAKALQLQREMGPVFDVACDCEDGAPVGREREHATAMAGLIAGSDNAFDRVGARVHDLSHRAWRLELDILVRKAGRRIAFLTLPKAESAADVRRFLHAVREESLRAGVHRSIPVSVLMETPGAVHDAWAIAGLPGVVSLDFGTLDFVSAHRGAIPEDAMHSPGQFDHPLLRQAKCEVATAALAHAVVPTHGVTLALDDEEAVRADALRARNELGYLRMWSIHPSQIEPIVRAFRPDAAEVERAAAVLAAAQDADWGPIRHDGKLYDRASYRYCWEALQRARRTGAALPASAARFFEPAR
ncbi:MAG TPA: aldolase/citrate lyase family protein [Casimicrobiaceae bacterium]|nr:aldolase/citrate lyase family protein [Casimicrobiaceae bacterium]